MVKKRKKEMKKEEKEEPKKDLWLCAFCGEENETETCKSCGMCKEESEMEEQDMDYF